MIVGTSIALYQLVIITIHYDNPHETISLENVVCSFINMHKHERKQHKAI